MNSRQTAITLAALRRLQQQVDTSPMVAGDHLESEGEDPLVKAEEIDEICYLVNSTKEYPTQ